jgi:hypothetical protein
MSSFSDSARWRWPPVSPADVRLKMARRPRREAERVGAESLAVRTERRGEKSLPCRFIHGEIEYGLDAELRDAMVENGEGDTLGSVPGG